jgi:hypothetical protein
MCNWCDVDAVYDVVMKMQSDRVRSLVFCLVSGSSEYVNKCLAVLFCIGLFLLDQNKIG